MRPKLHIIFAILVFVLAAVLRFWGIKWGLPNGAHSYSYHPDEFLLVASALGVVYFGRLLPGFYNYPSLFIYLGALAIFIVSAFVDASSGAAWVYFALRIISALAGVLAVVATYFAGLKLFNSKPAALISAVIMCIAPLHVQHSHFATTDVLSTLFVALTLIFCGNILAKGDLKDYILAGICIGLAVGSRYNTFVLVLPVIFAHIFYLNNIRKFFDKKIILSMLAVLVTFFITTPGVILQTSKFMQDIAYEFNHSSVGHDLVFAGAGNGFVYTFTHSLWYGLGAFLAVAMLLAIIYGLISRSKPVLVVISFIVVYYLLISFSEVRFARYTLPMYPAIALVIGYFTWKVYTLAKDNKRDAWLLLFGMGLAMTLTYTLTLDKLFTTTDVRDQAAAYIEKNVPKENSIGVFEVMWFYSPPLGEDIGLGALNERREAMAKLPYKMIVFTDYDNIVLSGNAAPKWVITSDFEIGDAIRLKNNAHIDAERQKKVKKINDELDALSKNYEEVEIFANELSFAGNKLFDMKNLPHDMKYQSPEIRLYKLK